MLKTLGIVKGTLLTEKQRRHLLRPLAGKSVLEWVVRQLTECEFLDRVVVLSDKTENSKLIHALTPIDIPVFASEKDTTIACLVDTLEHYPAESCVFIGADWPFLDPLLVDQLIQTATETEIPCDYAAYQFMNEYFSAGRPFGLFPEWYRAISLLIAAEQANDEVHRQLPGCFFLDHQSSFEVELLPAPAGLDRIDIRLTFDQEDDWENILAIHDALGMEDFNWRKLSNLLHHQPLLRQRMARLNSSAFAEIR
ncbi:MAG: NTP transferase domain-containing protein [Planctomycetaceae bacterium]|nr:NTP transferase domain-containing protein [Planctomycetaceae bacterium]